MKLQIDGKSAVLGFLLGLVVMFTLGAVSPQPNGSVGRFHIAVGEYNAFVLDTATGEVWSGHANTAVSADFGKPKL
jgi:hypothetical protein